MKVPRERYILDSLLVTWTSLMTLTNCFACWQSAQRLHCQYKTLSRAGLLGIQFGNGKAELRRVVDGGVSAAVHSRSARRSQKPTKRMDICVFGVVGPVYLSQLGRQWPGTR